MGWVMWVGYCRPVTPRCPPTSAIINKSVLFSCRCFSSVSRTEQQQSILSISEQWEVLQFHFLYVQIFSWVILRELAQCDTFSHSSFTTPSLHITFLVVSLFHTWKCQLRIHPACPTSGVHIRLWWANELPVLYSLQAWILWCWLTSS